MYLTKSLMKKVLIVNNNMKIGGVQKSLVNLLRSISDKYDITLLLFKKTGELLKDIPSNVRVVEVDGAFRFLGTNHAEFKYKFFEYFKRSILVIFCRIFGRKSTLKLMLKHQLKFDEKFDYAISFLHNGRKNSFYGGVQEFVLERVDSTFKIAFVHGDYVECGANFTDNDATISRFDKIAACSEGCKRILNSKLPSIVDKTFTVKNFHDFSEIQRLADFETIKYNNTFVNVIIVARLSREKGIERAIRAVSNAKDVGARVKLHIIGDGSEKEHLLNIVKQLNIDENVVFYGEQANPYRYIKNADLLLISSYHEAAPMVIDEAISLSVPILTTRTVSATEMVELRDCGWVCDNNDTALNNTFIKIISDRDLLKQYKIKLSTKVFSNIDAVKQFDDLLS